jgi:hypothetical protein
MIAAADCETVNCTEGGLLFGPGVTTEPLDAFLERAASAAGKDSHG